MSQAAEHIMAPEHILDKLSEIPEVNSSVATEAYVRDSHTEEIDIQITDTVGSIESTEEILIPSSTYQHKKSSRVPMRQRYDKAPSEPEEKSIKFIDSQQTSEECPDCSGSGLEQCQNCNSGKVPCPECGGDEFVPCECGNGKKDCKECHGTGEVERKKKNPCTQCGGGTTIRCPECAGTDSDCSECEGEHVIDCPECDGEGTEVEIINQVCEFCNGKKTLDCEICSGDAEVPCENRDCEDGKVDCTDCDGEGKVECSTCRGDKEVVKTTQGNLKFTHHKSVEFNTDQIPKDLVDPESAPQVSREQVVNNNGETLTLGRNKQVYNQWEEHRKVTAQHVSYGYNEDVYSVFYVDDERTNPIHYDEFPSDPGHVSTLFQEAKTTVRSDSGTLFQSFFSVFKTFTDFSLFSGVVLGLIGGLRWITGIMSPESVGGITVFSLVILAGLGAVLHKAVYSKSEITVSSHSSEIPFGWNYDDDWDIVYPKSPLIPAVVGYGAAGILWFGEILIIELRLLIVGIIIGLINFYVYDLVEALRRVHHIQQETHQYIKRTFDIDDHFISTNNIRGSIDQSNPIDTYIFNFIISLGALGAVLVTVFAVFDLVSPGIITPFFGLPLVTSGLVLGVSTTLGSIGLILVLINRNAL